MDNKKIPTKVGTIVLIIIAVTVFGVVWKCEKGQPGIEKIQPASNVIKNIPQQNLASNQQSSINWAAVQFDDCGGKEKYNQMSWWGKFITEIEKINYYSDSFIESQIESINNNTYLNPSKIVYTYQSYCNDTKNKNHSICMVKDKKLAIDNFNSYGEGCLSKDSSAFVAVFPGEYLGGGNYVFRYDITNNILEEAHKIIDDYVYWSGPPTVFGKRTGDVIKMTGKTGDAGCSLSTDFDYNIVENQIRMTKKCTQCMNEKQNCKTFEEEISFCEKIYKSEKVIINNINIAESIAKISNEKNLICKNLESGKFQESGIGIFQKKEESKNNSYLIVFFNPDNQKEKDDPLNQSPDIFRFDFDNNKIYFQSQFDAKFNYIGDIK